MTNQTTYESKKKSPIKAGVSAKKGSKSSTDGLSAKQQILKFAADAYCKGGTSLDRDKLIVLTKLAGKTVMNNLSKLKKEGLIEYSDSKTICLTEAGVEYMGDQCKILTPEEIRAELMEGLKGKPLRLYDLLKDGKTYLKDHVAKELDFEGKRQKGFQNLVGKLKSAGMVQYPDKDHISLTDLWLVK